MTGVPAFEVLAAGMGIALQDHGRTGWRRFGVPQAGVMDRHAAAAANRLLDNPAGAVVLELLWCGQRLRVLRDMWVAVAGAVKLRGEGGWRARRALAGEVLEFSAGAAGVWGYVAVAGGLVGERWFGSVAVDARHGLGRRLVAGDLVLAAGGGEPDARIGLRWLAPEEVVDYGGPVVIDLLPGPQWESFSASARDELVAATWTVASQSDRSGYRLEGPALAAAEPIRSEPVIPGTLQVPPGGRPIVTLHDGPTVGGYPKIAVIAAAQLDRFVQCRPGSEVQFRWKP